MQPIDGAWSDALEVAVAAALERAIADGVTPGAAFGVVGRGGARRVWTAGRTMRIGGVPVTADTRYDLASLTKVLVTLPLVLQAVGRGDASLDDRVGRFFTNAGWFQTPSLADVTLRALLTHTSGLPAWRPLFAETNDRRTALAAVLNTPVAAGGTVVYSDLGFMLLGALVERLHRVRLDVIAARDVFGPLGMRASAFGPVSGHVAATEDCGWRNRLLVGEVHDENASIWDGIAGHAGAFGTLHDVLNAAEAWLHDDERLAPTALLREARRPQVIAGDGGVRGLGWVCAGPAAFVGATEHGFGHTGFTGTSIWIDPDAGFAWVLLTNRVHPVRGDAAPIAALRRTMHRLLTNEGDSP